MVSWTIVSQIASNIINCGNFNPELSSSTVTCGGLSVVPVVFSDGTTKIFYPKFDSDGNYKVTSIDITSLLS